MVYLFSYLKLKFRKGFVIEQVLQNLLLFACPLFLAYSEKNYIYLTEKRGLFYQLKEHLVFCICILCNFATKLRKNRMTEESKILKKEIIEAIQNKKGENITIVEVGQLENAICDAFIICNANSNTQVDAIADGIEKDVRKNLSQRPWHVEGKDNSQWIIIDYVSVMVHIFQTPYRDFYQLEELWSDAPVKHIEE